MSNVEGRYNIHGAGFGFAGDMYDKESDSDLNLCVYVYVGRWSYVDSKEACVNRYYTSSISLLNCLGIPRRIRSAPPVIVAVAADPP
jgi:hypothetical protein